MVIQLAADTAFQGVIEETGDVAAGTDVSITIGEAWAEFMAMIDGFVNLLPNLIIALVILVLFFLIGRAVRHSVRKMSERGDKPKNAGLILGRVAQWAIIIAGALLALAILFPTFEAGQLITLLGIGTVAVGFAFRDILENFLAGFLILLTDPFRIGDQICVNDHEGTVEEIEVRATTLRTYDGRRVVIPNADLLTDTVTVNTAFVTRRSEYDFGIGYENDIAEAKRIMLDVIRGVEGVLDEPAPEALTVEHGGSSVNIRGRWWTDPFRGNVIHTQDEILTGVKAAFDSNGIDIPYPSRTVYFHEEPEDEGDAIRRAAE